MKDTAATAPHKYFYEGKRKATMIFSSARWARENAAYQFCEDFLKGLILKNVEEQLSCTELLHDLRVHCGEMFRDIKSIQASIMIDLLKENVFEKYIGYIEDYESCMKKQMNRESQKHFVTGKRFESLANIKLSQVITVILQALKDTEETKCSGKTFMKAFFSHIENMKISQNEVGAYLELDVDNPKQFSAIVSEQLGSPAHEDMTKTITSWDVVKKLDEKGLAQFLFTELVGCSAECPFCNVACDAHSGGKTGGKHSAVLHRPQGLAERRNRHTQVLVSGDCCSNVASQKQFLNQEDTKKYIPYKKYHTIYPEWTIHGNADPYVEKYWKRVLAEYNIRFAEYNTANEADVPEEWSRYTIVDIAKDIEDNYHIQVDLANI